MTTEKDSWALGKEKKAPVGDKDTVDRLSGLVDEKSAPLEPDSADSGWLSGLVAGVKDSALVKEASSETTDRSWLSGLVSSGAESQTPPERPSESVGHKPLSVDVAKGVEERKGAPSPSKPATAVKLDPPPPKPRGETTKSALPSLTTPGGPSSAPRVRASRPDKSSSSADEPKPPLLAPRVTGRQMVSFYRSLSVMLSSGIQLFACFEFLSRDAESKEMSATCKRIGQRLVEGYPLPRAVAPERSYFDDKTVKLLEVGYKSGAINKILKRLAEDEEASWKLASQLQSQLYYPLGIAALGTLAVLLLPPLVLSDLLKQVVRFTDEPPAITQALLSFSAFLSSPWTIGTAVAALVGLGFFVRTPRWMRLKRRLEVFYWEIPGISQLWRSVVSVRFLSVFALTYDCGLPATQCLLLASGAAGSPLVESKGPIMKETLMAGGTLRETMEAGDFLPPLVLEAVEAGQQTGKVADLLQRSADILSTEVQTRIETVAKLVEPLVLTILGFFVGLFALGCLLPIIGLVEKI